MRKSRTMMIRITALSIVVLGRATAECRTAGPTLARLSFWAPPDSMAEFETAYRTRVLPILSRHGLVESKKRGRATVDSVFSRLFEVNLPAEIREMQEALQGDSTWTVAMRDLGARFGDVQPNSLLRYAFVIYTAPAGSGNMQLDLLNL